ncbi:MAG TPA: glycosyltransferase family A protein [Clostridia bacterium]|nr:glycosyltransferase family A protein [Clostridia bacterium]
MAETAPSMTVVIITKDRPDDIAAISLPSLAAQTCRDFGVLVWDASADDATRLAVAGFAAIHPSVSISYARARRPGTCCQRNDAMDSCTSGLLFFIDDDVELMPTAVEEMMRVFDADMPEHIAGCQCALAGGPSTKGISGHLRNIWYGFWGMWYDGNRQALRLTGFNTAFRLASADAAATIPPAMPSRTDLEWLSGCAMAFRREVLVRHGLRFDERLMRFGGYGRGEDVLLSGLLHLRFGYDLACPPSAVAVHHHGAGGHGSDADQPAMVVYNHALIWQELMSARKYSRLALTWARTGLALRYAVPVIVGRGRAEFSSFRSGLRAAHEVAEQ